MEVTVSTEEIVAEYQKALGEANHQLMMLRIAYRKQQDRIREYEQQEQDRADVAVKEAAPDGPVRRQVARQVAPGLNGTAEQRDKL